MNEADQPPRSRGDEIEILRSQVRALEAELEGRQSNGTREAELEAENEILKSEISALKTEKEDLFAENQRQAAQIDGLLAEGERLGDADAAGDGEEVGHPTWERNLPEGGDPAPSELAEARAHLTRLRGLLDLKEKELKGSLVTIEDLRPYQREVARLDGLLRRARQLVIAVVCVLLASLLVNVYVFLRG